MLSVFQIVDDALERIKQGRFAVAAASRTYYSEHGSGLRDIYGEADKAAFGVGVKYEPALAPLDLESICCREHVERILHRHVEPKTPLRSRPGCDFRHQFPDAPSIYLQSVFGCFCCHNCLQVFL